MVVIEPVPSTVVESKRSTSTSAAAGREDMGSSDQANAAGVDSKSDGKAADDGYASDGFETASETEVGDDETVSDDNNNLNDTVEHQEHQPVEVSVASNSKDQSYEDRLNEDKLKQELIVQMNEAKVEGNKLFGDGLYDEALLKYDYAIQLAPQMPSSVEIRSICHNNRATCFFKLGKYEDSIKECTKALELNPTYMKPLVRKAEAHEKLENYDESIADLKKILELDPSNQQARRSIIRLEPLAIEKREKLKDEMLGKLKEMGNSVLGRFGMSVDNFKAVKDPNTGSYSISFQQ
ncbi:tetratricopeptide repeat protein 1-like [Cynara cardunculus var. scolymus]|uniref:Tetratricopeptide-like helical n=1 Tax=Cynara cardunculus var. scolymus TaxID=59895 RepID=A0A103XN18_CYNCS|nr:tetratricopeptide repeat protein 1-like [Cynara cardunculus var. scolymus]KVH93728.1 Tetratricopeptide-like helical [Cynara cardunculus var. scolymus]